MPTMPGSSDDRLYSDASGNAVSEPTRLESAPTNDDSNAAGTPIRAMPMVKANCTSETTPSTCFSTESAVLMNDDGPGCSPASTKVRSKLAI
jgi:hypothetical protein